MSFIPLAKLRESRLKTSKVVHLVDADMDVRVAKMLATSGMTVNVEKDGKADAIASTSRLFHGGCINEDGDPLFKSEREAADALKEITLSDASLLITAISDLAKPDQAKLGNSEGTPVS